MNTVSMSSQKSTTTEEPEMAHVLQTTEAEQEICTGSVHRGENKMFDIFTQETTSSYQPILLDPHTTSPGQEESAIVRNDQPARETNGESEIYQRARRIFYRGRRTSMRRAPAGII